MIASPGKGPSKTAYARYEPMTGVTPMRLKRRVDVVTDGGYPEKILANAPDAREGFFAVPKVVE